MKYWIIICLTENCHLSENIKTVKFFISAVTPMSFLPNGLMSSTGDTKCLKSHWMNWILARLASVIKNQESASIIRVIPHCFRNFFYANIFLFRQQKSPAVNSVNGKDKWKKYSNLSVYWSSSHVLSAGYFTLIILRLTKQTDIVHWLMDGFPIMLLCICVKEVLLLTRSKRPSPMT